MSAVVDDETFVAAVATAFSFLVTQYGFTRHPIRVISYERHVVFERPELTVTVAQEIGSAPWVTLLASVSTVPRGGRRFGLHELEQEMERTGRYQRSAIAGESLEYLADVLARTGSDVLNGDFSILVERERRHVEAGKVRP